MSFSKLLKKGSVPNKSPSSSSSSSLKAKRYNSDTSMTSPARTELIRRTLFEEEEEEEEKEDYDRMEPIDPYEHDSFGEYRKMDHTYARSSSRTNRHITSPYHRKRNSHHQDYNDQEEEKENVYSPTSVTITSEVSDLDSVTSISSAMIAERIEAMVGIANRDSCRKLRTYLNTSSVVFDDDNDEEEEDEDYGSAQEALFGYKVVNSTSLPLGIVSPSPTKRRQEQEQRNTITNNTEHNNNDDTSPNQLDYRQMVMGIPSSITKSIRTLPSIIRHERRRIRQETKLSKNKSFREHCFYQAYQVRYQLLSFGCVSLLAQVAYNSSRPVVIPTNASFGALDVLYVFLFMMFLVEIQTQLSGRQDLGTRRMTLGPVVSSFSGTPSKSPARILTR
uniref:Uncharacterized protein n=1 Tax=Ditylum brightwellii TaxID=49249 RepID=A0A7S4RSD9_9STRA